MFKNKKTYLMPIFGFALLIIIGAVLLSLPVCNNRPITFQNALFTATSGVTTTGFTKVTLVEQFNFWGQLVLAILMEIGAMGFIIFISYFWSIKDKKIKMSDIMMINDNISGESYSTIKEHSIFIGKFMLKVQIIGSIMLFISFIPKYGPIQGVWYSIFHTISAFSNTGFDLMGNNSFISLREDVYTQIVLAYSVFILFFPTLLMKVLEPEMSLLNCFFMSTTSRSTGFSIVNMNEMQQSSKIILTILMFIGGGPTSTAGGVRIIPIAIVLATIVSTLRGKDETIMFWRKIPDSIIKRAFTILLLFIFVLIVNIMIMSDAHNLSVLEITFNSVSAISNTGLTLIDMNSLNTTQEICIILLMFIGRVGILSLVLIFFIEDKKSKLIKYPNENVIL